MTDSLYYFLAVIIGGVMGYGFGKIQMLAQERYTRLQKSRGSKSGMTIIPGSLQRTSLFLLLLILIQIGLPALFAGNIQWLVSAGVLIGYGWTLLQKLRERIQSS